MKLNTKNLQKLAETSDSDLKKEVLNIIISKVQDYDKPENFFNDLFEHGCISGMIGELTYYTDTVAFFERNKDEIFELAIDQSESYGDKNVFEMLAGLNGADIGSYDQFANLLSWYSFEETARNIYEQDFELEF